MTPAEQLVDVAAVSQAAAVIESAIKSRDKVVCRACMEEWEVDKFVPGQTACPACTITSEVRLVGKEYVENTSALERKDTQFFFCDRCKSEWVKTIDGKVQDATCPLCHTTATEEKTRKV